MVDALLGEGYEYITLLDTSNTCLNIVKQRLNTNTVPTYICSDILDFKATKPYVLWHDRAVFHFLLSQKERDAYFKVLHESLLLEGIAIINTFSKEGEMQCAGLDIVPYDKTSMRDILPKNLELIFYKDFIHTTPRGTEQKYASFIIKKLKC